MSASLFDSTDFTSRLFFPRDDASEPPPGARDDFVAVPGASLHLRYHGGASDLRTLLLFHGNGEVVADYDDLAPRFAAIGARLVVVDYRGYGQSTGTPTLRSAIADAEAVVAAVHATADAPIVVMGRSLGSACANDLYARTPPRSEPMRVAGFVVESGFSDLAKLVRRRGMEAPEAFAAADLAAFDPLPKLARGTAPLLVIHGEADTMIAAREAQAAHDAAGTRAKKIVIVPRRGHNDVSASPVYWQALRSFLASLA